MLDLHEGILQEFTSHQIPFTGFEEGLSLVVEDPNARQRDYSKRQWRKASFRKSRAAYMREYNKRPDRKAKRREYERKRRARAKAV